MPLTLGLHRALLSPSGASAPPGPDPATSNVLADIDGTGLNLLQKKPAPFNGRPAYFHAAGLVTFEVRWTGTEWVGVYIDNDLPDVRLIPATGDTPYPWLATWPLGTTVTEVPTP